MKVMAKPKLTYEQNISLKGLSLEEKLNLLHEWKKNEEIDQPAFEHFSNLWIKKESKKIINANAPLRRRVNETLERSNFCCRTVREGQMQVFIDKLRGKINDYIANRSNEAQLTDKERNLFYKYVKENVHSYRLLVNQMLILGLRYPDKELNSFCSNFVQENKKGPYFTDYHFWGTLWEDPDFVPLDAIRLMLVKKEDGRHIDNLFAPSFIQSIIPLIEAQRNKEVERLKFAQMLEGKERETQVKRKMERLNAFNILLKAAEEYCS